MADKMRLRPIMESVCVLFAGSAAYKIRPVILLEMEALHLYLRLPKFVANNILCTEVRLPCLLIRFQILTIQTFLKIYNYHQRRSIYALINKPNSNFEAKWSRLHCPHSVLVQTELEPLKVDIINTEGALNHWLNLHNEFDGISPPNAKRISF